MAEAQDFASMTTAELTDIANLHSWGWQAAREELTRRAGTAAHSADAQFIASSASRDAGRIIKHLWIIFVLLPIICGVIFVILTQK